MSIEIIARVMGSFLRFGRVSREEWKRGRDGLSSRALCPKNALCQTLLGFIDELVTLKQQRRPRREYECRYACDIDPRILRLKHP
jgi:hypothetical protein